MTDDSLNRLRHANPFPGELPAPPFDRIRGRLDGGAARERPRRRLRLGAAPVALAVAVSIVVIVVAIADLRTAPSRPTHITSRPALPALRGVPRLPARTPANRSALAAVALARNEVIQHDRGCGLGAKPLFGPRDPDRGTPARYLLDAFSVLRTGRRERREPSIVSHTPRVFVRYVRVTRSRFGRRLIVYAERSARLTYFLSSRCLRLVSDRLRHDLATASPKLRRRASQIERLDRVAAAYADRHPEALCVDDDNGGTCGDFFSAVTSGLLESAGTSHGGLFTAVVPDGVASLRVEYPGRSFIVPVFDNVAVWRRSKIPGTDFPTTILWRAPDGRVVWTVRDG